MSYRADPEACLLREMEEALGPDAVRSVSRPAVLSSPAYLSKAANDAQLRPQSYLHTGILSMEQDVDRIASGTDAGPQYSVVLAKYAETVDFHSATQTGVACTHSLALHGSSQPT